MTYREDIDDFRAPMEAEIVHLRAALNTPVDTSIGADARLGRLQADKAALNEFNTRLAECIARGTFSHLPSVRTRLLAVDPRYKVLEVGPYRGVFLVDRPSDTVVGMIFSKAPHELRARIARLGAEWADLLATPGEQGR